MYIAIASGKGGTGKTSLAVNLSAYIRDVAGKPVTLVDLDVEEPNTGIFLRGETLEQSVRYRKIPRWNKDTCILSGECAGVCNYNAIAFTGKSVIVFPELCHGCYACSELCPSHSLPMVDDRIGMLTRYTVILPDTDKTFTRIESRLDIGREMATPLIAQTIDYVNSHHDSNSVVLFDAPPGNSCSMMEAAKRSDYILLVAEPTLFGLNDLQLAVETLRKLQKDFSVVINKDNPEVTLIDNYCKEENIRIIGRIPHMIHAAELYSRGELMYNRVSEVRHELKKIYDHLQTVFYDIRVL